MDDARTAARTMAPVTLHRTPDAAARLRDGEGPAANWLLLIAADRVDAVESHLVSLVSLRPDNRITGTGIRSELTHHGLQSRFRAKRADIVHHSPEPLIVAGPWLIHPLRHRARCARPSCG